MKDYIDQAILTESKVNNELLVRMTAEARALHAIMGLTTEIGELVDIFKKHIFYNKEIDIFNVEEETGDMLWYLAILFHHFGFNFESVMVKNITKLRVRYPNKFTEFDAMNRNLDKERAVLELESDVRSGNSEGI